MRLNAPADMVGTGVPLLFRFYFLAEADLTGERPFHTCTQDLWQRRRSPNPHHTNWRRLLFFIQKRPENRQDQISNTVFKSRTSKVFMENP